jgi:hypothetical protein
MHRIAEVDAYGVGEKCSYGSARRHVLRADQHGKGLGFLSVAMPALANVTSNTNCN